MPRTRQKENDPVEKQKVAIRRGSTSLRSDRNQYRKREGDRILPRGRSGGGLVLFVADNGFGFAEHGGTSDGYGQDIAAAGNFIHHVQHQPFEQCAQSPG